MDGLKKTKTAKLSGESSYSDTFYSQVEDTTSPLVGKDAIPAECVRNSDTINQRFLKTQYVASIDALNKALSIEPENVDVLFNKALSEQSLASLHGELGEYELAKSVYEESLETCEFILSIAPEDIAVLTRKGIAIRELADLQRVLANSSEVDAHKRYEKLLQSGFIGIGAADPALSATYKSLLYRELRQ